MGKLYDSSGNRMSPSFSRKNGVRYRFYVSSALLRGRKGTAGSVPRVSAQEIESRIIEAIRKQSGRDPPIDDAELVEQQLARVEFGRNEVTLFLHNLELGSPEATSNHAVGPQIKLSWPVVQIKDAAQIVENVSAPSREPDQKLVQALVRAHCWSDALLRGTYASVEELAAHVKFNPKVVRNELRLAHLAPEIIEAVLAGSQRVGLPQLRDVSALNWRDQVAELSDKDPQPPS